jgi:predicted HTH domain antitoxin
MQVTVELPDDTASLPQGERTALAAFVVQALKDGVLSKEQGRRLMNMERFEFDDFIRDHQIERFAYNEEDLARDVETLSKLSAEGFFNR